MDDTLQRLLETEARAEKIAKRAEAEGERMMQRALRDAKVAEQQFEPRIPELRASFTEKAEARAEQAIAELKHRYDERHAQLREMAEEHEDDALDAAFAFFISPTADDS